MRQIKMLQEEITLTLTREARSAHWQNAKSHDDVLKPSEAKSARSLTSSMHTSRPIEMRSINELRSEMRYKV
jgi:hypothetical protein